MVRLQAHSSIGYRNDTQGNKGVYIDQEVVKEAAAKAITGNLRRLGPSVLPWSEMVRFGGTLAGALEPYA